MEPIIPRSGKIVVSCDGDLQLFMDILRNTGKMKEISAYKIPAWAGETGWKTWTELNKISGTGKKLIYDHQALGTDVSHVAGKMLERIKSAGFDAIILKPKKNKLSVLGEYIQAAKDSGLGIMVVGHMTDDSNSLDETEKSLDIYELARGKGVADFGVPGNNPEFLDCLAKRTFRKREVALYPIGIGKNYQGGDLEKIAEMLSGFKIHPIIGRAIYESQDMEKSVLHFSKIIRPK